MNAIGQPTAVSWSPRNVLQINHLKSIQSSVFFTAVRVEAGQDKYFRRSPADRANAQQPGQTKTRPQPDEIQQQSPVDNQSRIAQTVHTHSQTLETAKRGQAANRTVVFKRVSIFLRPTPGPSRSRENPRPSLFDRWPAPAHRAV